MPITETGHAPNRTYIDQAGNSHINGSTVYFNETGVTQQVGLVVLSGSTDAVPTTVSTTYIVTTAGVDAMTLAAPTATTYDGTIITISSTTTNAHTLTATGLLQTGTASVNVATFAAQKGAGLTLLAYQGKWQVLSSVGITFS